MMKFKVEVNARAAHGIFVIEYPSQLGDLLYSMAEGLDGPMDVVIERLETSKEEDEA